MQCGLLCSGEWPISASTYVLDDETRVLARAGFVRAIGRTGKVKGGRKFDEEFQTPVFLTADNLKPFFPSDLDGNSKPIFFTYGGTEMIGYRAELLPDVLDIFADADRAGVLRANQRHIADACRLLARGLTRVGIIGLVDEATGYQKERAANALARILEQFIAAELQPLRGIRRDPHFLPSDGMSRRYPTPPTTSNRK